MLAQERYQQILVMLEKESSVKVSKLMKMFDVSIETVRRDLEYLEKEGYLKRVYGGAVLENVNTKQVNFKTRENEYIEEKKEISDIAVRFIREGQSIALDSATTTLEIAEAIKKKFERLTVLTNSIVIASELSDMEKYTIILCGGILKSEEFSLVGDLAISHIGTFHIDTAFIGASGISLKEGITDYDIDQLSIQKKIIEVSQQNIIVADSSKFDRVSLSKICDLDKIDMIITDSKLKPKILEKYLEHGIEVINK